MFKSIYKYYSEFLSKSDACPTKIYDSVTIRYQEHIICDITQYVIVVQSYKFDWFNAQNIPYKEHEIYIRRL